MSERGGGNEGGEIERTVTWEKIQAQGHFLLTTTRDILHSDIEIFRVPFRKRLRLRSTRWSPHTSACFLVQERRAARGFHHLVFVLLTVNSMVGARVDWVEEALGLLKKVGIIVVLCV